MTGTEFTPADPNIPKLHHHIETQIEIVDPSLFGDIKYFLQDPDGQSHYLPSDIHIPIVMAGGCDQTDENGYVYLHLNSLPYLEGSPVFITTPINNTPVHLAVELCLSYYDYGNLKAYSFVCHVRSCWLDGTPAPFIEFSWILMAKLSGYQPN
jgi:hypothetical protein